MADESTYIPKVTRIYLQLSRYPILADTIRERMRQELFRRGVITRENFEAEAREKAVQSQYREGMTSPQVEEPVDVWERRLARVRDDLTDFYFAYNLTHQRFEDIVREVLQQRRSTETWLAYNPELASMEVLFHQAEMYYGMPPEQREAEEHNLQETKVVLIKALISDDLEFVRLAKEYLTVPDLQWIRAHRVGRGKIGGKAAGLVLASKILQQTVAGAGAESRIDLVIPQSYFVGADVIYEFLALNNLLDYLNQKYKSLEQIEADYPAIQAAYAKGKYPEAVLERFRDILAEVGDQPLIVRSSSLLEDNFGATFAGKYESVFCPNQGTPQENLSALTQAISRVYASVFNPNALIYRKQRGLLDFDERMAVLLQVVQGRRYRQHFFPAVSGIAYSRNPFIWNPKLRREDGFMRIVAGLGTRAVERVGEDYPRMVALSNPQLRPETTPRDIRYYSQYYMDVLNLETNAFETRRVAETLAGDFPGLRFLASQARDDLIARMVSTDLRLDPQTLVLTFEGLLGQTRFAEQMRSLLKALELGYGMPVDVEFTVSIGNEYPQPGITIHLLQCRPQAGSELAETVHLPEKIPEQDIIFGTERMAPTGRVTDIAYIVYVDPEKYAEIENPTRRLELARVVRRLNQRLESQRFILLGPGRWGSSNLELGLRVGYADIYNTKALVEIGLAKGKTRPTLSYGTHFFQDLVEARIYPLAIYPGEPGNPFQAEFFRGALNALPTLLPQDAAHAEFIKVIDVRATTGGKVLELVMGGDEGKALAFLTRPTSAGK
jgi:hypothetical protein